MIKTTSTLPASLSVLVIACAMSAVSVQPTAAQTARNLICNGCVNSKDIKNASIKSRDIRNGHVRSIDLATSAKPAGADFAGPETLALTAADQTVVSVMITAPGPGVVIVNASGYFSTPAQGLARCSITTETFLDFTHLILDSVADDGTFFRTSFAGTRGFEVASAGTTTYNFVCNEFSGAVTATASVMTAMFFPQRY